MVEVQALQLGHQAHGQEQRDLDLVLLYWGDPASAVPSTWINDLPTGLVDQDELDGVLLHWGDVAAAAAGTASGLAFARIPEPETWLLALLVWATYWLGGSAASLGRFRHLA